MNLTIYWIKKIERLVFIIFLVSNLIVVLFFKFTPTLDGPAHLYNSTILKHIILSDSEFLKSFYTINQELVPNWSGHFLLVILSTIISTVWAEKILIALYLIFLPLSFRWFIKSINPNSLILSYFIFPFCFSFTFFLGFYNFSLALVLMFLILTYYINNINTNNLIQLFTLFFLFGLIYFSHLFVFFISLMAIGVLILSQIYVDFENNNKKYTLNQFFKRIIVILISSGIWIYFGYNFLASRPSYNFTYIEKRELLKWIRDVRPTVVFNFGHETIYTRIIFFLVFVFTLMAIYQILRRIKINKTNLTSFVLTSIKQNDLWLVFSFALLGLYLLFPDSNGYSGYFTVRMGLMLFLFYIVWLATKRYKNWVLIVTTSFLFIINTGLNIYYLKQVKRLNELACEIDYQSKFIKDNSVIIPMNFSSNWMHGHFSNYLGIEKPVIILENYECGTGYFPLLWQKDFPDIMIGQYQKMNFVLIGKQIYPVK